MNSKEPQITLQNKETAVQSHQKISIENTKKNLGIKVALFSCTGELVMDNFGCLNSSLSLFY